MALTETTRRVKAAKKNRSKAQRLALMKAAYIIDDDGKLAKDYFSAKTIDKTGDLVSA